MKGRRAVRIVGSAGVLVLLATVGFQTYLTTKELMLENPSLRSMQAIHLALALELRPLRLSLVSSDKTLLEMCRPLGIKPINPED